MISSLMLNLKGLQSNRNVDVEERTNIFDASSNILKEMYVELKNICFNLMPQTLKAAGVGEALKEFASRINNSGEVYLIIDLFGMEKRLTDIQEISLYRISQEWVNNVLKYSNATKISLQITKDEDEITLLIEDNGSGFDPAILTQGKGNGWKNIQSRAKLIQGDIDIDTTPEIVGSTFILNAPAILVSKKKSDKNELVQLEN
jgi:two-component system, NarL family, sensor kinase